MILGCSDSVENQAAIKISWLRFMAADEVYAVNIGGTHLGSETVFADLTASYITVFLDLQQRSWFVKAQSNVTSHFSEPSLPPDSQLLLHGHSSLISYEGLDFYTAGRMAMFKLHRDSTRLPRAR